MFYRLLRVPATWVLRVYFRRIYIDGSSHIPNDEGALLVSNHPNAFLEACLMACFQSHDLYFLVRGDVFKHPIAISLLRATHQIPIYRFRDGFSNLKRNAASFKESYEVLKRGDKLLIFGEASTHFARRLRPLQRGAARILQGVTRRYPDEEYAVIPTSVYFSEPERLRSTVRLRFGKPIDVSKWLPLENDNEALDEVTSEIASRLLDEMVHIPKDVWEPWMESWLLILQNEQDGFDPGHTEFVDEDPNHWMKRQVDRFLEASDSKCESLHQSVVEYLTLIEEENIEDRTVQIGMADMNDRILESILAWPVYFIGKWCNFPPLMLSNYLSNSLAPKREFIASLKLAFLLILYPIYFIILIILGYIFFSLWGICVLLLPVLGAYALRYEDINMIRNADADWNTLPVDRRSRLRHLRNEIIDFNKIKS